MKIEMNSFSMNLKMAKRHLLRNSYSAITKKFKITQILSKGKLNTFYNFWKNTKKNF